MNNYKSNTSNPDPWSLRVDGKVALVTGAAGGLGRSFTQCLLEAGATVIASGRRREALEQLQAEFPQYAGQLHVVPMDVTDAASVSEAFAVMAGMTGIPDIVVSNAGIATNRPSLKCSADEWDRVVNTNLKGCWLVANEAARRLSAEGRSGSIIMISSILGHRVAGHVAPYAAAKAGVEQLTRPLRWNGPGMASG